MTISGRSDIVCMSGVAPRLGARALLLGASSLLVALSWCAVGRAGILTNFAASYAQYENCCGSTADIDSDGDVDGPDMMAWQRGWGLNGQMNNSQGDADGDTSVATPDLSIWKNKFGVAGGLPSSTCFKLYLDPQGISAGQVTLFVDTPSNPGENRFLDSGNGIFNVDPRYKVQVLQTTINRTPTRLRLEAKVRFDAINPFNPPSGPVTIFGFQVHDNLPTGTTGVLSGFNFNPGDFVATFDTNTLQLTTFTDSQINDVSLNFESGFLSQEDAMKAIDVDPLVSNSSYAAQQGPLNAYDQFVNTKYRNTAKRNAGFIAGTLGAPTVVKSLTLRSALDTPIASDPASYQLFGTNSPVTSPDNSNGSQESWTLISQGSVNMPLTRGDPVGIQFVNNNTEYRSYRVVFPETRDFRAADSTQVADVGLYQQVNFTGNILPNYTDPRAIQLPTPQADSPPGAGPQMIVDGDGRTKYQMLGKQNSGFIITPQIGATQMTSFVITTAGDTPERDPSSYILYGTNDSITSQDYSQGNLENWTLLSQGTFTLPDERLALGPRIAVNAPDSYTSYRLVFPTMKNVSSPVATSMQFSDIQFYRLSTGAPSTPTPEPATLGLIGWAAAALVGRRASRRHLRR